MIWSAPRMLKSQEVNVYAMPHLYVENDQQAGISLKLAVSDLDHSTFQNLIYLKIFLII